MANYDSYIGKKIGNVTVLEKSGRNLVVQCHCGKTFSDQADKITSGKRKFCRECSILNRVVVSKCIKCNKDFENRQMVNSKRFGLLCSSCYSKTTIVNCSSEGCVEKINIANGNHSGLCEKHRDKLRVSTGLYYACKNRARSKGLDFDLDLDWIYLRLDFCEVTGVPLEIRNTYEKEKKKSNYSNRPTSSPSVDRVDPTLGYTKTNCRIVCWWYNLSKSIWSDDEVLNIVKYWIKNKGVEIG